MSSASGQARPVRNMEVPEAGAWGRNAPPVCAPDPRQMRRALDQQLAMQRGYGQRPPDPCNPPLPGSPLQFSAAPSLVEQLSAEVAALREQVAGLSRMVRSGAMQSSPFAPLLAAPARSMPAAPSMLRLDGVARLAGSDAARLELRARLDYLSRAANLRRSQSTGYGYTAQLAFSL